MKTRHGRNGIALRAAIAAVLAAIFALTGCPQPASPDPAPEAEKPLDRIAVTTPPSKTTYLKGEDLKLEGLVVTAYYTDESSEPVAVSADAISGYDKNTARQQTVTVTLGGKTATFTVTVRAAEIDPGKTLDRIAVMSSPGKTAYSKGADLNLDGLVVTAYYTDGSSELVAVTAGHISGHDKNTAGPQTITVTLGGKTATFTVTVEAAGIDPGKTLERIAVTNPPNRTGYTKGEDLDLTGLVVTAYYTDGSSEPVALSAGNVSGYDKNRTGQQTLTITISGKTATFTVTVEAAGIDTGKTLERIAVTGQPNRTGYTKGEDLDLTGLVVTAYYTDGSSEPVAVTINNIMGYDRNQTGPQTLTITISGKTASFTVTVSEPAPAQAPLIGAEPVGGAYHIGAEAAPLTVTASAADGGALTYRWYQNGANSNTGGTAIPGAEGTLHSGVNGGAYTPPTGGQGTFYYYVMITNTKGGTSASTASAVAAIEVNDKVNARQPEIQTQPQGASYSLNQTDAAPLSVSAASPDGGTLSYRWYYNDAANSSDPQDANAHSAGTGAAHAPSTTAAGTRWYFVVVTNDITGSSPADGGVKTAHRSSDTAVITVIPPLTGTVSISGTPVAGQTLTANTANLEGSGDISYRWNRRDSASGPDTAISGAAGPSYTVQTADADKYITVTVIRAGYEGSKTSNPTAAVTLPELTGTVSIGGTAKVGQALSANTASLGGSDGTISYQWNRRDSSIGADTAISGKTGSSYILAADDLYKYITVTVTRSGYNGSVTSAATVQITKPDLSGTVSISGSVFTGYTLTAVTGALNASGAFSYQWNRRSTATGTDTVISGANNSTYPLGTGDLDKYITVTVTRSGYNGSVTSAATVKVRKPTFTSTTTLGTWLQAAAVNTAATPYDVALSCALSDLADGNDALGKLFSALSGKYVSIDLSGCTGTSLGSVNSSRGVSTRNKLVAVILPAGLTSIGKSVFEVCENLTMVSLPASLTSIGESAFMGCKKLALTSLPASLTSIGGFAFYSCEKLALTSLPANLTSIGTMAFYACESLALTSLPAGITSIGNYTFEYCTNLALASLPANLTSIGNSAFERCTNLALTSLPASLTFVGNSAFRDCTNLALTSLPAGLTIRDYVFSGCTNLALTSLPANLTSIGQGAFSGCTKLALTSLPAGLTAIKTATFENCTNLAPASLPAGLTSIEGRAFKGCTKLALTSLPAGLTSIGDEAFSGCTKLALTSLPAGITAISDSAFRDCTSLALTNLPTGLATIGAYAFYGCTNLTQIKLERPYPYDGNSTIIGDYAFYGCTNLALLSLNTKGAQAIGTGVFDNTASGLVIKVPSSRLAAYKAAGGWSAYADRIIAL